MHASNLNAEFHGVLLESIDETMHMLLGDRPYQVLFERLSNDFHLKRELIPDRLDDFERALTRLCGTVVARVLTRAIVRGLHTRLEIPYHDRNDYTLKMYVQDCRRRFEQHIVDSGEQPPSVSIVSVDS